MTEPESTPPFSTDSPEPTGPVRRSRLRIFVILTVFLVILPLTSILGIYLFISSATFKGMVRKELIAKLEDAFGGRVEIDSFHWKPLLLEADANGLVIHGLEDAGDAPYAQIDHLRVRINLLILWSPRILLRDLELDRPKIHFIVYPDGSTNQPQPRKPRKKGKSELDTFFNLKAGYVLVRQGELHYEDRASSFDYQDRYIPLGL